jgi:hypothetical protein
MTDLYCSSDCMHFKAGKCGKGLQKPIHANNCEGFEFKPRHTLNWDY